MNLKAHLNHIAFSHSVFSLPFAYTAAFLAARGVPDLSILLYITIAVIFARAAAVSINNIADLKFDRKQPRMAGRALVSGALSERAAKIATVLYLAVVVAAVCQLPPICIKLLPIAIIPFVIYPFTKRITFLCHFVLGLAVAMAPAGAWVAVKGSLDFDEPMMFLCAAVALWIGMFDAIYGAQDERFDRSQGLHSLATEFGAKTALKIAGFFHFICAVLFFWVGWSMQMNLLYFIGSGAAAGVLSFQYSIVKYNDFSRVDQSYFLRNGVVSIFIFVFTALSLAW